MNIRAICRASLYFVSAFSNQLFGDWPQFRGPNGQGIATAQHLPLEFDVKRNLIWSIPMVPGASSPVIRRDGAIITTGEQENRLSTICISPGDGKVLWSRTAPTSRIDTVRPYTTHAAPTPVTDGIRVFSFFGSYGLIAYGNDGSELWKLPLQFVTNRHGLSSSPVLAGGHLFQAIECDGGQSHLLALDPNTGKVLWRKERPLSMAGWSTPMNWKTDKSDEILLLGHRRLDSYDLHTGEHLWWLTGLPDNPITIPVATTHSLVVAWTGYGSQDEDGRIARWKDFVPYDSNKDSRIQMDELPATIGWKSRSEVPDGTPESFFPARDDFGMADSNHDGFLTEVEWDGFINDLLKAAPKNRIFAIGSGAKGDAKAKLMWTGNKGVPELPSPVIYRDRVYTIRDGGILTCLNVADGKIVYQERTGAEGHYQASPIICVLPDRSFIVTASTLGVLSVIPTGDIFSRATQVRLNEPITSTPAVDPERSRIYIRSHRHLFAFSAMKSTTK